MLTSAIRQIKERHCERSNRRGWFVGETSGLDEIEEGKSISSFIILAASRKFHSCSLYEAR